MKLIYSLVVAVILLVVVTACGPLQSSSTEQQARQQENLSKESNMEVGMPAITNFAEKRELKDIYELRDRMVATTTYIVDLKGRAHKLCNSVGYGIPYATEYDNPESAHGYSDHPYTLPQADPNGLFSPADAEGTWVECVNPVTKRAAPLYVEPRIIVSPFPLPDAVRSAP